MEHVFEIVERVHEIMEPFVKKTRPWNCGTCLEMVKPILEIMEYALENMEHVREMLEHVHSLVKTS